MVNSKSRQNGSEAGDESSREKAELKRGSQDQNDPTE